MMATNWGLIIKKLREDQGLTQGELAEKSGVDRSWLSHVELSLIKTPIDDKITKLARGLDMTVDDLRREIYGLKADFPQRDRIDSVIRIPVYTEFPFHAGSPTEPVEYYPHAAIKSASKNIEAYIIHAGNCLAPKIESGDIILVDREGQIDNGDIVACLISGELHVARLRKVADELWLENNFKKYRFQDCQVAAPVIEVIKRLK